MHAYMYVSVCPSVHPPVSTLYACVCVCVCVCMYVCMQWRSQVFFTIASNTPGPEASQLQTHRNYGRWSVESKSCAPGDLAAQGYGHYPGMRRLRVHHSWVVSRRVQIFLKEPPSRRHLSTNISSRHRLQCHLGGSFPRRMLMFVEGQSQKTLVFLINASRFVLFIIVYSITKCRGVAWPPNLSYNSRC